MAGNSSKVPVVRCPKCGRLLPELPPYSVYCCGGCGGYLRAEKKLPSDGDLSESLSEERHSEGSSGVDNGRRTPVRVRFRFGDSDRRSPVRETNSDGLDDDDHRDSTMRGFGVQSKLSGRSGDGDDGKSPSRGRADGCDESSGLSVRGGVGKGVVIRDDRRPELREDFVADVEESFSDRFRGESMVDWTWVSRARPSVSPRRRRAWHTEDPSMGFGPETREERVGRRADGSGEGYGNLYGRRRVEIPYDDWVGEGDYVVARGNRGGLRDQDGYVGVFAKPRKIMEQWADDEVLGAHQRVPVSSYEGSLNYRAELLSKYNKLHEQLIRIGDQISHNGQGDQGIASTDSYGGLNAYVYDEFSRVRRGPVRSAGLNGSTMMRPHYISGTPSPSEFPFHDDPSLSQIPRRTIYHQPPYYHEQFATRRSMDSTYDPRRENLHHIACTCSSCHTGNLQARMHTPGAAFGHKGSPKSTRDLTLPKPTPHNLSSYQRSSADSKSDKRSSAHDDGKRVLGANQDWQLCYPIAGGAPFMICYNCFQLLRLPGKLIAAKKKQFNLQCGSCRTILSLDFNVKKSDASDLTASKPISADACSVPCEVVTESHHNMRKSESYEYNGNGCTFPYTDSEPSSELEDRRLLSAEPAKRSGFSAPSSHASKDAHSSETAVHQIDASAVAEKPSASILHPLRQPPGSPVRDHMDYMSSTHRIEKEESDTSNQDKEFPQKESSVMTFVRNAAVPSEWEPNSGEIPNTDTSQGSADTSTGKHQGGVSEASELSFATSRLNTSLEIVDVFVNGKPIIPSDVRTAEKMAGPISPGEYWYDSTAGFWGVVGGCCLGIIPPCIKEFSSLMPANCSSGETCIYVNGRELHANDLDMLSSRGFPRKRYKYYLVDISGKVHDERTGAFVLNIGKLAPTVESSGCGFGMQPPGP